MVERIEKVGPSHQMLLWPKEPSSTQQIKKTVLDSPAYFKDTMSSAKDDLPQIDTLVEQPSKINESALEKMMLSLIKAERLNDEESSATRMIGVHKQMEIKKTHTKEFQKKLEEMAKNGELAKYLGWAQIGLTGAAAVAFVASFFVTLGAAPAILAVSSAAATVGKTYQTSKVNKAKGEGIEQKMRIQMDQKRIAESLEAAKQERERVASLSRMQKEVIVNSNDAIRKLFR